MSGYILGIVSGALAIGVAECLIPENAKTKGYVRLLFGLALLLVVIKPLGVLIKDVPNIVEDFLYEEWGDSEHYEEIADEELCRVYKEQIYDHLKEKFNLSEFSVGVKIGEDRRPIKVIVTLMGRDIFKNPHVIEDYVGEKLLVECVVVVG